MFVTDHLARAGISLTKAQEQGLSLSEDPTLLLAVPGSGKTTVLIARTAALLEARVPAHKILSLTFSRKSAADMQSRFEELFSGCFQKKPKFRTIHSLCYSLLAEFSRLSGRVLPVLTGSEGTQSASMLLRDCFKTVFGRYPDDEALTELESFVGYAKNRLLTPSACPGAPDRFPELFALYERLKKENGCMDYDDLPLYAVQILKSREEFRLLVQKRYSRIQIDEAQDLSVSQHVFLRLLSPHGRGMFFVGDEDQSIYGFRGASPRELMRFASDYPGARIYKMEENYRSRAELTRCASAFIRCCPERYDKRLIPMRGTGGTVESIASSSLSDTLAKVVQTIKAMPPGQTAGILFRNNFSAGIVGESLVESNIPYRTEPSPFPLCKGPLHVFHTLLRLADNPMDYEAFRQFPWQHDLDLLLYQNVLLRADRKKTVPELLEECAPLSPRAGSARNLAEVLRSASSLTPHKALRLFEKQLKACQTALSRIQKGDPSLRVRYGQMLILWESSRDYKTLLSRIRFVSSPESYRPEGAFVTLSTIHGAKGLEFDRVLLLDAFDGILPGRTALEALSGGDPAPYYEEMRLFYVAATRAKEALTLFSPPKDAAGLRESRFIPHFYSGIAASKGEAEPYPPGTTLVHRAFGSGLAVSYDGDCLTIDFSGKLKTVSLSYCISHKLLHKK